LGDYNIFFEGCTLTVEILSNPTAIWKTEIKRKKWKCRTTTNHGRMPNMTTTEQITTN
jgi:hypothetical protein